MKLFQQLPTPDAFNGSLCNDSSEELQSRPLCAAVQIAQNLQNHYGLTSILADNADAPYDDFWNAVELIAGLYFNPSHVTPALTTRNVHESACDTLLVLHFGRCDAIAKAALVLGLGWALVERRSVAQVRPVH